MALKHARFVSRLTRDTVLLILAGGRGSRLEMLTEWRAKPAVPFGGKFRIIDFSLSNCFNSGIHKVCVLTQYKSHSLIRHIVSGWSAFNYEMGQFVDIIPAQQWVTEETWFQGTADAVFQSLDIVESYHPSHVLVLAGDHVYKMDYGELLAAHANSNADMTIACNTVPVNEAKEFGVMTVDANARIMEFTEKPERPRGTPEDPSKALVSMGIYAFSFEYLCEQLRRDAQAKGSSHDFGNDLIPHAVNNGHHVQAYSFAEQTTIDDVYWRDVGTVDAYYKANMELVGASAKEFGVMTVDANARIMEFTEKPERPRGTPEDPSKALVSMGIYAFSFEYLCEQLRRDAQAKGSSHDFGNDLIPHAVNNGHHVQAYSFAEQTTIDDVYWRDVGTVDAYYKANMELVGASPQLNLYDPHWRIWTYQEQLPPASFVGFEDGVSNYAVNSMVSGGCVIQESTLDRSLLFSGVVVRPGCALKDVLALPECTIGEKSRLTRVLLDNGCQVPAGTVIGEEPEEDARRFHRTAEGVVVVNREMLGQGHEYLPIGAATKNRL